MEMMASNKAPALALVRNAIFAPDWPRPEQTQKIAGAGVLLIAAVAPTLSAYDAKAVCVYWTMYVWFPWHGNYMKAGNDEKSCFGH